MKKGKVSREWLMGNIYNQTKDNQGDKQCGQTLWLIPEKNVGGRVRKSIDGGVSMFQK